MSSQLEKINQYVDGLVASQQIGDDMQSMLFTVDGNEIGGDNTGTCTNGSLVGCAGVNASCTNKSSRACNGSTNTIECLNQSGGTNTKDPCEC